MSKGYLCVLAVIGAISCGGNKQSFSQLAGQFVYESLALSPVSATAAGYHRYQGVNLDEILDDASAAGFEKQRQFYRDFRQRLQKAVAPAELSAEDRADYEIIQDQISLQLLDLERIQSYRHNPTIYVELLGNALFNPYVLEYAPKPRRISHIVARMQKFPAFLDQARQNLVDSPEIWTTVALEENDGNIGLIDKTIRAGVPEDQRQSYDRAAKSALDALRVFQQYLKIDLAKRNQSDWRLGRDNYAAKFRYALGTDLSPERVLASAEADLNRVRARMLELAQSMASRKPSGDPNRIISDVLARIGQRHSTPDSYVPDAKGDLEEARQFVAQEHLLSLPPRGNLRVIETPEFMRGVYAVGGFNAAPALEPRLGAFYWVTPIPKNWPQQRIESKLREYNFYKLKLLTIHEAMPGHYVQLEFANDIQPKTRRVLRSIYGSGPYIEGWAQYATQMMLDAGFLGNPPELRLTFQKEELRVLANAILDIRLHTMGMTDQQALELMEKDTFQETEEATAKLRRAKLSSCQLPMYLVGWRDWLRVREQYKTRAGGSYQLSEFNRRALEEGAVPLPVLARLLTGKPSGETPSK